MLADASLGAELRRWRPLIFSSRLIGALFLADALLLLAHISVVLASKGMLPDGPARQLASLDMLRITRDGSVPEYFEYAKTMTCAVLLLVCFARTLVLPYAILAGFFVLATADNFLSLHETAFDGFGFPSVVEKALFFACVALAVIVLLVATWPRAGRQRQIGVALATAALALPAAFAFFVDAAHALAIRVVPSADALLSLVEDGGELVALTVSVALCRFLVVHRLDDRTGGTRSR